MVFEAVIVDVLNRFLGNYVENLNKDQLKLGIWGGDVVLKNLTVKQTALEELDFPVKTVYGHLGKLVLKIPWKNLYGASVEATIDSLLLIVNPIAEVKYDAAKEEQLALAAKQAELRRIEEAKKREAEKGQIKLDETFVEKLVTQIIKNVQLKITDIHVRYEDRITNPKEPFSCGFTLHNLSVHTTDEGWHQAVLQQAVTKIFKILTLDGLAIYWNSGSEQYSMKKSQEILTDLKDNIARKKMRPNKYDYVLGPINATAKLQLTPKPEADKPAFSVPKVVLTLHMEELAVSLKRVQYQDIMMLVESFDTMTKAAPYRKHRPDLKFYRGHYKAWWHFAYNCILKEEVQRRRKNWDWNHMKAYKNLCLSYADAYRQLKLKGNVPNDIQAIVDKGEKELFLLSLVIIRQRIDMEVEKIKQEEKEAKQQMSWFSQWWSGGTDYTSTNNDNFMKRFEDEMTPDEKAKLFRAIDYQENSAPLDMPVQYVSIDAHFALDTLQMVVTDQVTVLRAAVHGVEVDFKQRPGGNAMRVDCSMNRFSVYGVKQEGREPHIVTSKEVSEDVKLINVMYETNPIEGTCNSRVRVSARPLQIIYDAQTVIEIVNVFKPPQEITALATLQEAAHLKLLDLKEKSAIGMQYMVMQHNYIEIDVEMGSSYVIIPYKGFYRGEETSVILQLGKLSVKSEPRTQDNADVSTMHGAGYDEERILAEMTNQCYDKFAISLTAMQLVLSYDKEDWHEAISNDEATDLHLLAPLNLVIRIHKCVISDDPRLPKVKVICDMENVNVCAAEDRMLKLFEILVSMPLPASDEPVLKTSLSRASSLSLFKYLDSASAQNRSLVTNATESTTVQLTNVEAIFVLKKFEATLKRKITNGYDKFLVFSLYLLEVQATQKTFTLNAEVKLGAVFLHHHRNDSGVVVSLIDTPKWKDEDRDQYLFNITYCNVNKKCPEFRSFYHSVEQMITLDFSNVRLLLHLECIQELLTVVNEYQMRLEAISINLDRVADAGPLETIKENEELTSTKSKATSMKPATKKSKVETIQLKVIVKVENIGIVFATDALSVADVELKHMTAGLIVKLSYTQIDISLGDIRVLDLFPHTVYKQIVKVMSGDVANIRLVLYNTELNTTPNSVDMSIEAQFNCLRIVFINRFVNSMLDFLNNFQEAQKAIIEASTQAADAARANVQSAYENSTKIDMKFRLAAPIIIVPENSNSYKAILIDFGKLFLDNTFLDASAMDIGTLVTTDRITLDLEEMKLSFILMNEKSEIIQENTILKPISFTLLVTRNLSMWYDKIPDLEVSGRLKSVVISLTPNDYQSIMKILTENLQEGADEVKPQPRKSVSNKWSKVTTTTAGSSGSTATKPDVYREKIKTSVKFQFTMDSFVIDLMQNVGKDSVPLAKFSLVFLCMQGRMFSDQSMNTSILLIDCTIDDSRPGRGDKITRYLQRRRIGQGDEESAVMNPDEKEIRSMVDITFTKKENDTFVDVRIFSFNLILAMDFMNKLSSFLSVQDKAVTNVDTEQTKRATTPIKVEDQKSTMMTINIVIENPDIILVETLDNKECDALVLNMESQFKYRQRDNSVFADGGISGLQIYIRKFGVDESDATPHFILSPTSLSVALSQPPDMGMHVDIALTDVKISVSPDVLGLVNRVIATVTSSEEDDNDSDEVMFTYDDVWAAKPFEPASLWYLKTEIAQEATEFVEVDEFGEESGSETGSSKQTPLGEICLLSSPSIVFSFELEIGSETLPMLVMQASLTGQVKDWSTAFVLESTWAMQVSNYNIQRAMWEPVIEPVEILENAFYKHVPWELKIAMEINPVEDRQAIVDVTDEEANLKAAAHKQARTTITFSSEAQLDITISRSGLEVLTDLSSAFSAALSDTASNQNLTKNDQIQPKKSKQKRPPYVFHNYTGLDILLQLDKGDFSVFPTKEYADGNYKEVVLQTKSSVPLHLTRGGTTVVKLNQPPPPLRLHVKVEQLGEIVIPVERADKRFFPLGDKSRSETRGLLSEVAMKDASLNIYLRSILQIQNNLSVNVSVYYMKPSGNEVSLLGEVKPGDVLRLPVQAVYTPSAELFFSVEGFTVSVSPFAWRELQQEVKVTKLLHCKTKELASIEKFYLWVIGEMEQAFFESTTRYTFASSCFNIRLETAVTLQNCLPVDIIVSESGLHRNQRFKPGELHHLSHLAPNKASIVILIKDYLDKSWACTSQTPTENDEFSVWSFVSHDSPDVMTLDLGMHNKNSDGRQILSLYCPFWMLNKTGLTLSYRKSKKAIKGGSPKKNADDSGVIFHPPSHEDPILFSFRAKNFFGKKKASIRVEFGEWSDKFSLDIAGSSGVVLCKNEGRTYQVAVTNTLTFNSLTKMVIFVPYFVLTNLAPFDIEYQEAQRPGDPWKTVTKKHCASVWPVVDKPQKLLILRVKGTDQHTAPMIFTDEHSTCLKLHNQYGGFHVEVQISEGGTAITVRQYVEGHAPALLVNYSPYNITVNEKDNVNVRQLESMRKMMFTWDNPSGPRELVLEGYKKRGETIDLIDGIGSIQVAESMYVSWVSFLDDFQRVVLVTDDIMLARGVHTVGETGILDNEIVLSMKGMGISLVNDYENQEILYISACNSGIIWEQCKLGSQRYKKVDPQKAALFETVYQRYQMEQEVGADVSPIVNVDEKTQVDLASMRILKPSGRLLRRTLAPALWARVARGQHAARLHARLHRLQLDVQLAAATFPVALAPVPPPSSVHHAGMKPFIEVSIVEHILKNSSIRQYKYFKVLIQEFHVKFDMDLINALVEMFPQKSLSRDEALDAFNTDLALARQRMEDGTSLGTANEQYNFYDDLHLSPLKVHLSFSLGNSTTLPTFVGTILQGIGVTLTDMNDVVFKLSYYERKFQFLTQNELMQQIQQHYTGQALKQLYVLVLGLDVLGNPYGLVIGLKKGVEDLFYEPIQGAILGPGEFAEGLYIGVRSLVGHTLGGAAGAFSRITGAMGHGIAALSMDEDFQRQRRNVINKPSATLQEGLARSGRGLVMGFVDGVTGVITKPIEGAQAQGVGGFFKGLGRGAVGLVARPTAGVVDFAAGSFGAVKRAADLSEDVTRRRPPRYMLKGQGVTPFSHQQAEGFRILSEIDKGKYLATDTYEAHVWVILTKEAVLCTDKRIIYVEKNAVFGGMQVAWTYLWVELQEKPTPVAKGVFIPTGRKKVLGMFHGSNVGKVILIADEQHKQYLLRECDRLMSLSTG